MEKETRLSEAKRKLLELQTRQTGSASAISEIKRHPRAIPAPLSLAQEQVWRLDQSAGKLAPLHNESITIHRRGPCDPALLERSLSEIVRRHEIWRTTFETMAGQPVQIVHPAAPFPLALSDLRALPKIAREARALELATHDAALPFDLQQGPLVRARLVTLDDAEHRLYVTAHQSIVDGITVFDIFPTELTTLYESFAAGTPSRLPEMEMQYADFASWQRRSLGGEKTESQLAYWQRQLGGELPVLQWPNNGLRPRQQTYRGAMHSFMLPGELAQSLKDLGRREGVTLFMILLAALVTLLQRYTGQDEIVVGTLAPCGRKQTEFQRSLGYFLNPVVLRADLRGKPDFSALLRQMREVTLGAISNDDVTLDMIAERLHLKPDPSRHPFFTVALSVAPDVPQLPAGWSMTYMDVESGGARWDLYLEMSDRVEGLLGRAQYNPDLFTGDDIAQTLEDFRRLLEQVRGAKNR
ncbi:MAG TPA: condensation domain-containing protein [Terriglobales bacterium]|nr:condensation domain-containing protein [Terriglobales bacterium]